MLVFRVIRLRILSLSIMYAPILGEIKGGCFWLFFMLLWYFIFPYFRVKYISHAYSIPQKSVCVLPTCKLWAESLSLKTLLTKAFVFKIELCSIHVAEALNSADTIRHAVWLLPQASVPLWWCPFLWPRSLLSSWVPVHVHWHSCSLHLMQQWSPSEQISHLLNKFPHFTYFPFHNQEQRVNKQEKGSLGLYCRSKWTFLIYPTGCSFYKLTDCNHCARAKHSWITAISGISLLLSPSPLQSNLNHFFPSYLLSCTPLNGVHLNMSFNVHINLASWTFFSQLHHTNGNKNIFRWTCWCI